MAENRGGRRQGRAGKTYAQRTDLMTQPIRTPTSTHYGEAAASARSQAAAPLPQQPGVPPSVAGLMAPAGAGTPAPGLFRDTERPGEPLQQGLGSGPQPDDFDLLRALKEQWPTAGMVELFQSMYGLD